MGNKHKVASQVRAHTEVSRRGSRATQVYPLRAIPVQNRKLRALLARRNFEADRHHARQSWSHFGIESRDESELAVEGTGQVTASLASDGAVLADRAGQEGIIAIRQDEFSAAVIRAVKGAGERDDVEGQAAQSCPTRILMAGVAVDRVGDQCTATGVVGVGCFAVALSVTLLRVNVPGNTASIP